MPLHWTLALRALIFSALNAQLVALGEALSRLGRERPLVVAERRFEP